jgi:hypothetical protein
LDGDGWLVAGTAWFWTRADVAQAVDVLVVDEARRVLTRQRPRGGAERAVDSEGRGKIYDSFYRLGQVRVPTVAAVRAGR